jgi:hypothetical protein
VSPFSSVAELGPSRCGPGRRRREAETGLEPLEVSMKTSLLPLSFAWAGRNPSHHGPVICDERGLSDALDDGAHGYVSLLQMALFSQDEPSAHDRTAPKVPDTPAESSCLPGEAAGPHLVSPARQWPVKQASRRSVKLRSARPCPAQHAVQQ